MERDDDWKNLLDFGPEDDPTPPPAARPQLAPANADELVEAGATRLTYAAIRKLQREIDADELAPSIVTRIAEAAHKISGAPERRSARLQSGKPTATVHFLYEGDPEPPASREGAYDLRIRFSMRDPARVKVIDAIPTADDQKEHPP